MGFVDTVILLSQQAETLTSTLSFQLYKTAICHKATDGIVTTLGVFDS